MASNPNGSSGDGSGNGRFVYPFFVGVVDGAAGRAPTLLYGALRTGSWLGLAGPQARSNIVFHNHLSWLAVQNGYRYLRHADIDREEVQMVWDQLPREARENTIEWGAKTAGGVVGGAGAGVLISKQLGKYVPKKVLAPTLFFLGCQGFLASVWKDAWGGGPPPPPGGMGGGGGGITT